VKPKEIWYKPKVVENNNCYNYAVDDPANDFRQMGVISNSDKSNTICDDGYCEYKCENITENTLNDIPEAVVSGVNESCQTGFRKICNFIRNGSFSDYHWYRQDEDGSWSDKPGWGSVSVNKTDIESDAKEKGYREFCNCFCIPDKD